MKDSMRQTLGGFFVGVMTSLFIMVSQIRNSQTSDKTQSLSLDLRLAFVENAERISIILTRREFKWIVKSVFKKSGMVAPVSRSEFDERLADSYEIQCIMNRIYDLWFKIIKNWIFSKFLLKLPQDIRTD